MIDSTNTGQDFLISPLWKRPLSSQPLYSRGGGVPSLVWFCLQCIAEFPDQVQLDHKLVYRLPYPPLNDSDRFLASMLTGSCSEISDMRDKQDPPQLDPRLWAVIAQIFDHLPLWLRTYTISLNDEALPLLQQIPNTAAFSLMTILELPGCAALTDSSISQLKDLHTLTAFDASNTGISSYGLLSLARTLQMNDPLEASRRLRGPWQLRILRFKHCAGIDDSVYATLPKFPLLSVVDLRGTSCHPRIATLEFPFSPNVDRSLFSSAMVQSLNALLNREKDLQMHSATKEYHFALRIKTLCHESIAKGLNQNNNHLRPLLYQPSRISAHEYDSHRSEDDRSDQYSEPSGDDDDGEDSALDDMDEQGKLSGNTFDEWEEGTSDEVGGGIEEREDLNASVTTTEQHKGLPEKGLNESQKISDGPLFQPMTMILDDEEDEPLTPPLKYDLWNIRNRQKPHWYDADWARENTYVPISLAEKKYSSKLMLYRPARSWDLLENELNIQLTKEARRKQVRDDGYSRDRGPNPMAPSDTKSLQVQADIESMAAEALRRRRIHTPPTNNEPSRAQSRNFFARKPTEASFSVTQNGGQPKGKPLKPISALQVPKITHELLQQTEKCGSHPAGSENERIQSFRITRSCPSAATLPTKSSLARNVKNGLESASSVSADLRGESSKRKMIRRSEQILMSSGSMMFKAVPPTRSVKGGRKERQKTQSPSFDWAAWASKKC